MSGHALKEMKSSLTVEVECISFTWGTDWCGMDVISW